MKNNKPFKISALALFAALCFGQVSTSIASAASRLEIQDEIAPASYLNLTSMCSNDPSVSRRWRVRNATSTPIEYTWNVYGTSQSGSGLAAANGDTYFETAANTGPNTTKIYWTVGTTTYNKVKASGGEQCITTIPCGSNLIVNGDFESGNTGFTSQYTFKTDVSGNSEMVSENTFGVDVNVTLYHPNMTGLGRSGKFLMVNGNTGTVKTVWSQSINVSVGATYDFYAYVQRLNVGNPSQLKFYAGEQLIASYSPSTSGWVAVSASYISTVNGPIELKVIDSNLIAAGNDFGFDDISFVKVCVEEPQSCYASEVISFNQKKQNDGSTVSSGRSDATKALGAPQNNDTENFVSLGFGGDITLKFANPIKNGAGNDVRVTESTFGGTSCARFPETIRAFASQDGCHYIYLGEGCQDAEFDLGSLAWAQYIKLVDVSPIDATYQGTPVADAYDVDAVKCLNGSESNPVPSTLVTDVATQVIEYMPGLRKNGTAVTPARAIPTNALLLPQGTNNVNFVALGFGGSLALKFDYVIFDNAATNDISLVETSYGNPSCASYSEKVMVEGSLDGENWIMLTNEDICQDGEIDINNAGVIQYIRLTDRSASTKFSGTADGYDVDGLVVINDCHSNTTAARISDNTTTANEVASAEVFPNPFNESTNVEITTGDQDNSVTIRVVNFLGQQVYVETLNVASSSVVRHNVAMNELSKGVYFLTVETNTTKEIVKLVKN